MKTVFEAHWWAMFGPHRRLPPDAMRVVHLGTRRAYYFPSLLTGSECLV